MNNTHCTFSGHQTILEAVHLNGLSFGRHVFLVQKLDIFIHKQQFLKIWLISFFLKSDSRWKLLRLSLIKYFLSLSHQDDKWCLNIWFVMLYSILSERGWVSRLVSQSCVPSAVLFCVWCTAVILSWRQLWPGETGVTGAWGQWEVHGIPSVTTLQEAAAGVISWLQQVRPCRMYQHRVHWPALRVSSWCHAEWSPGVLAQHGRVQHHRLSQHDSVRPLRHWRHGQGPLQDAGPGQCSHQMIVWPVRFPLELSMPSRNVS